MVTQRKICLLGATGVGKTSLVRRFVESMFSEKYHATIGVKIDRKLIDYDGTQVSLLIWDLQGENELHRVRTSYLRGASGLMFVADGTRPDTVAAAGAIRESARETIGDVPAVLVLNKWDLRDHWRVDHEALLATGWQGSPALLSSAKSGEGVEDAFTKLVRQDAAI